MAMYPDLRALATDESFREQQQMTADVGFPRVIRDLSPPGLRGLMLVTFFAAFMSTISTQVNWGASYLVRDVYQRFLRPDASDAQLTPRISLGLRRHVGRRWRRERLDDPVPSKH